MNPFVSSGLSARHGMTALSVNVNKIALLRNQRHLELPSVTRLSRIALEAGAHGITIHPRPDERHIRASDARELALMMKAWPDAEFNIEGNPFHNLMPLVRELRPHQCTFCPMPKGRSRPTMGSIPQGRHTSRTADHRGEGARRSREPVRRCEPGRHATRERRRRRSRRALHRAVREHAWHGRRRGGARELRGSCAAAAREGLGVNAGTTSIVAISPTSSRPFPVSSRSRLATR